LYHLFTESGEAALADSTRCCTQGRETSGGLRQLLLLLLPVAATAVLLLLLLAMMMMAMTGITMMTATQLWSWGRATVGVALSLTCKQSFDAA
jgi:hypothetical protein